MRHNTAAVALALTIAIVALASALMVGCVSPPASSQKGEQEVRIESTSSGAPLLRR